MKAVIPGSFDPLTVGHLDIITRASRIADHVIVAVGVNPAKASASEMKCRLESARAGVAHLPNVEVLPMRGLLVDFCAENDVDVVVKGIRTSVDMDSEMTQAVTNREIGGVETLWIPTDPRYQHVSSSLVRELFGWGMDVSRYVPSSVLTLWGENRAVVYAHRATGGHND